ncbi:NADH-quinone oxidoreductase subunit C [Nocardioides pantholopis]|uniref:NADH-quinone oxidoreductase subunit C n=1 Tax=Nocardioides pantholopis TaxID=2483798 RepID=UPI000FD8C0A0|nr:NADH-quinone oxidoreductase subunit C [Nocardioides pantholopis]
MSDPESKSERTTGPEQAAVDQSPVNVPAPTGHEVRQVGERHGMFGASGSGDTSGYGGLRTAIAYPGNARRPYGGWYDEVADALEAALASDGVEHALEGVVIHRGELTLHVRRNDLLAVMRQLRDQPALRFELCTGVSGVHYPEDHGRELHAVYHLCSMTHNRRLRVETTAPDADPHVPSTVSVYPALDWHERETWDMFGLIFDGHPALTRILMPDDWPGHPQRKEYPLGGIPVEYKGGSVPPPDQRRSYS